VCLCQCDKNEKFERAEKKEGEREEGKRRKEKEKRGGREIAGESKRK
jgi:hypothetical protein